MTVLARFLKTFLLIGVLFVMSTAAQAQDGLDPENTLYMDLEHGRVVIRLRPDLAPRHVERIK